MRTLHEPIVYTSAACGADLLLIEAALERGAEVNVVLPFDRDDFVRTSVAVGGDRMGARVSTLRSRARTRVIMATEEGYLGDDMLFEHAAMLVEGLAMLRGSQLEVSPRLLCLVDPGRGHRVGGARESLERWTRVGGASHVIDLGTLRRRVTSHQRLAFRCSAHRSFGAESVRTGDSRREAYARALKTMLFADFAGYSRLHDAFAPLFQTRFLEIGAALIDAAKVKPLEAKTWGDAVYAVFESPRDGAEFALRFLERMLDVDWTAAGLSTPARSGSRCTPVPCSVVSIR